ncbi:MAG: hypothetical protein WB773_09315, partial [Isosphaeraceae bacterium]
MQIIGVYPPRSGDSSYLGREPQEIPRRALAFPVPNPNRGATGGLGRGSRVAPLRAGKGFCCRVSG